MKQLNISVENFGLIKKADITLKPLTIFLGENNTGKSYIAQLIYALTRAIRHLGESQLDFVNISYNKIRSEQKYNIRTIKAFKSRIPIDWDNSLIFKKGLAYEIPFGSLPSVMANECNEIVKKQLEYFPKYLEHELTGAYGVKLSELNTKLVIDKNFLIRVQNDNPLLEIGVRANKNRLIQYGSNSFSFKGTKVKMELSNYDRYMFQRREQSPGNIANWLMARTIQHSIRTFTDIFPNNAFYFPAARSGILQGQKLIARAGLRSLKRAGLDSFSLSKLPGVVVDFLDQIYSIDKDIKSELEKLSTHIEKKLIAGAIGIIEKKEELPEIYFNVKNTGRFPLHRTSSMVSELAPIILMLRYLIEKKDIIILEEPESHLHPKLQREFAKIIANFIRNGLNVLITTHSDYFAEQLSNIVALSSKPENIKENLGYDKDNMIYEKEVSAYRFLHGKDGYTEVSKLKIDTDGISDAGFGDIAESLYDESVEAKRNRR
jgi:predicted ATPase